MLSSSISFHNSIACSFDAAEQVYESGASLQRSVALRLAKRLKACTLPIGLRLDVGAGTGLLARAIEEELPDQKVLRIDRSTSLLAQDSKINSLSIVWNLNDGPLPVDKNVSLIASSFAIQWLVNPTRHIQEWSKKLTAGGWLAIALPTSYSFPQWYRAAAKAHVTCTAFPLPNPETLIAVASDNFMELQIQRIQFTQKASEGIEFLRQIRRIGAQASLKKPLNAGELRKLNRLWSNEGQRAELTWDVLLILGQKN